MFNSPQLVTTRNLNQAAVLLTLGGKLQSVENIYPNNTFVVTTNPFVLWYEKHVGLIPYRKYCNQRIRLKERGRTSAGLPKRFTGRTQGFKFEDIAHVRSWTKKELSKATPSVDTQPTGE